MGASHPRAAAREVGGVVAVRDDGRRAPATTIAGRVAAAGVQSGELLSRLSGWWVWAAEAAGWKG